MSAFRRSALNFSAIAALLNPLAAVPAELPVPCAAGTCGTGKPDVFVTSGQASYHVDGHVGTIEQLSDRAILNWQQFNVDDGAKVVFKQPRDISVALNRIYDQSPSKILGAVTANGQIYLINPNGMIFGENARVNVNTLIASSLDIADSVFNGSGLAGAINDGGGVAALTAVNAAPGRIDVTRGAVLETANGGQIFIFAPTIVNEGRIVTPGGQTILGASKDSVYLEFSTDPAVRGFLVEVGASDDVGGGVTNVGEIVAERGNITMAGLLVRQQGVVSATTSVDENGSIRLLARDSAVVENVQGSNQLLPKRAGTLTLGQGSTTAVTPDQTATKKGTDAQKQQPSTIELMGKEIRIESNAHVVATGGQITATATQRPDLPLDRGTAKNDSLLVVENGALIDASGDDTTVLPMSRNQVELDLRSNELADSPLQRGGALQGKTVSIDARKGTTVANAQRAIDNIARPITERLSAGGTIALRSEGNIDLQPGSVVDVSGGQVLFDSGVVSTTKLTSAGKVYDITTADPNRTYDGVFSGISVKHPDWGVTEYFADATGMANSQFEEGYVEGKDAGRLDVVAHEVHLDGELLAGIVAGRYQRTPTQPLGASLAIDRAYTQIPQRGQVGLTLNPQIDTVVDVTLGSASMFQTPGAARIGPEWVAGSGLGALSISTYGNFAFAQDTDLSMPGGSNLSITAGAIRFDGGWSSPSGTVKLRSTDRAAANAPIEFGSGSRVDLAGVWVNDDPSAKVPSSDPLWLNGGSIDVLAAGDFAMQPGEWLDVSGGAWLHSDGSLTEGSGGLISLATRAPFDTHFIAQGGLAGFALHHGGTLRFEANGLALYEAPIDAFLQPIIIYPTAPGAPPADQPPYPELPFFKKADATVPSFFLDYRGFENFAFVANRYGVVVDNDASIEPRQRNFRLSDQARLTPSGRHLSDVAKVVSLPDEERRPINLTLGYERQLGTTGAESVVVQPGARIGLDIGGTLTISSEGSILINGALDAPGGTIDLSIDPPKVTDFPFVKNQELWIGSSAALSATGAFIPEIDPLGLRRGEVLPGGSIELDAAQGFVVVENGARFDIGGIARELDITRSSTSRTEPVWIASDAGSLIIRTAEGGLLAGAVNALNERPESRETVRGGLVEISIDPNRRRLPPGQNEQPVGERFPDEERILRVSDSVSSPTFVFGENIPQTLFGQALVDLSDFVADGVDSIVLGARNLREITGVTNGAGARLRFESDLTLEAARSLVLDSPNIEIASGHTVALTTSYARVGYDFIYPRVTGSPLAGTGTLSISGRTIDLVGNLQVDGTSNLTITSSGDVRLRGTLPDFTTREYLGSLETQGNLTLAAARIYPTTLTQYTAQVSGGRLAVERRDAPESPFFSAAGSLALIADDIDVGGRVYVPQGQLTLTASNTLELRPDAILSTALTDDVTLFGQTQAGLDWIYPFPDDRLLIIKAIAGKSVELSAPSVIADAGSVVDLSGGGVLRAYEFVAGPGGSQDYLAPANAGDSFAILPVGSPIVAPYEPANSASFAYSADTAVYLSGIDGLAAGEYAVLPARYALLPGAMLVTPKSALVDMVPGEVRYGTNGAPIVAGRFTVAGTGLGDSRWSGFEIQPGSFAQQRSEYVLTDADEFFEGRASALPRDGGAVSIVAQQTLSLNGIVKGPAAAGGRRGTADLVADRLAVIAAGAPALAGFINLTDAQLRGVDVGSLMFGASRHAGDETLSLDVKSSQIVIGAGASLAGREIILAGRDVVVSGGAQIDAASSEAERDVSSVSVKASDGSAVLVASSRQLDFAPVGPSVGSTGTLKIEAGARIGADRTIVVEAPANALLDGNLSVGSGAFILGSGAIALGSAAGADATILDDRLLAGLGASQLTLASREGTRVYGDVALAADRINLDGPMIAAESAAATLALSAQTVVIENSTGSAATMGGTSNAGFATINAGEIRIGSGAVRFAGFDSLGLAATSQVVGTGRGALLSDGALTLSTPILTVRNLADVTLQSGGALTVEPIAGATGQTSAGQQYLGGALRMRGSDVTIASNVIANSGVIEATADNDLRVAAGGVLDTSGVQVTIGTLTTASAGGRISMAALSGDLAIDAGAGLTVAPGGNGTHGGRVEMLARQGSVTVDGGIAGGTNAEFRLEADTVGNLGSINAVVEQGGFDGARSYRARTGDLMLDAGQTLTANRVALVADTGTIGIGGTVHVTGGNGSARMSAGGDVVVSGTIASDGVANATLSTTAADGSISIDTLSSIAINGGDLIARAEFTPDVGDRLHFAGSIDAGRTIVDLVHTVNVDDGVVDASDQAALRSELTTLFGDLTVLRAVLPADAKIASSVELRSIDGLSLSSPWNLITWSFADVPGTLSFRAAGDIALAANLSDGFGPVNVDVGGVNRVVFRPLATRPGWSYAFVAGADLASADTTAVVSGIGSVQVGSTATVRTTTGDITIHAGNGLEFLSGKSSIYTSGQTTGTGGFSDRFAVGPMHDAQYPDHGGSIDVEVGGDISGVMSKQLVTAYMARFGGSFFATQMPPIVGVAFGSPAVPTIEQNLGSFGGGAVRISAGGQIRDLTVVVPDTLQHAGDARDTYTGSQSSVSFTDNSYLRRGTTTLDVASRGDISGGLFYLGSGAATLTSERAVAPGSSGMGALLLSSDASFDVSAHGDVFLESMFNPTMLPQSLKLQRAPEASYFFTYTDRARLAATSYGADVVFENDVQMIRSSFDYPSEFRADLALDVYPSTVTATALSGNVALLAGMTLMPGSGGIGLYAAQDVIGPAATSGTLYLSDADPALLPNPDRPAPNLIETEQRLPRGGQGDSTLLHASVPVHTQDTTPSVIVARDGVINAALLNIISSESLRISAASDVNLGRVDAQNLRPSDITSVVSGGDIRISSERNEETGQVITNARAISVGGPGEVQVTAGRSIDLGSSVGIQSIGDLENPALANDGANVSIVAGNAGAPDVDAFVQHYFIDGRSYDEALLEFASRVSGSPVDSVTDALDVFLSQPTNVQQSLILEAFFTELKASGIAAAEVIAAKGPQEDIDAAYAPGQLAISTLFPDGRDYRGDLSLFFSRVTTLDGGNISLVVPDGIVNAGLATTSLSSKGPAELGIVAQRQGGINVYAGKDVQVNQSRVFTLSGGDISIWSETGNIDAGRGAKTALATPGLSAVLGENDSVQRVVPPVISGSGIAAAAGPNGELPDIVLSTPEGIVDAGDAGIRTPGRLFTAATEFLGRDNVEVGSFVGAPVGAVTLSADLASVGDSAASASEDLAQAAVKNNEAQQSMTESMSQTALGWLEVFLEGYGEADKSCDPEHDPKCQKQKVN